MKSRPVHAPRFPASLEWLGVADGITLESLTGRVVLVEFWTLCCINCNHNIAQLKELRRRFGPELVILGVHSPKFPHERSIESVRTAIDRMGIDWPVLHDPDHKVREEWAARAWPTTVLVDGRGRIAATLTGERMADSLAEQIQPLIDELQPLAAPASPLHLSDQAIADPPESMLRYPGGIAIEGDRLWVSDTGHDRVLELELSSAEHGVFAKLVRVWGGSPGFTDGLQEESSFRSPRGLHYTPDAILVADTGNHAVRRIDLRTGVVTTLAGTGRMAPGRIEAGPALDTDLRSPWDIAALQGMVLISMAGSHQLWLLADGNLGRFAGDGNEGLIDGAPGEASFAQPSGIDVAGTSLWIADAEASAIREISLTGEIRVRTRVGRGLFIFGDRDGNPHEARLQHPVDVLAAGNRVLICDTYNHRIRMFDAEAEDVLTIAGSGERGRSDGLLMQIELNEPEAIALDAHRLVIADTGNHRLVLASMETLDASTLLITGLAAVPS